MVEINRFCAEFSCLGDHLYFRSFRFAVLCDPGVDEFFIWRLALKQAFTLADSDVSFSGNGILTNLHLYDCHLSENDPSVFVEPGVVDATYSR